MEPTERRLLEASKNDRQQMTADLARVERLRKWLLSFRIDLGHTAFVSIPWLGLLHPRP
jgi:hypothetical protein